MTAKSKKTEPFQFSGVVNAFVESQATDVKTLPLENIRLPKNQPRRYFDPDKLEELKQSIKQHGILEPLIVRPLENNTYELIAGERRYRAAQALDLKEVPVIAHHLSDEEAIQIALVENLQREDLNPVEETEAILQLLAIQVQSTIQEIPSLLYQMQNEVKGKSTHNVVGKYETEKILEVFNSLGLINWESFVNHRLPLLKLPENILEALRQGKIAYTKAQAIARIKDEQHRQNLLEEAIANQLSLSQIKERIAKFKKDSNTMPEPISYQSRLKAISQKAKKAQNWHDQKKKRKLEKLLGELEVLLADD